MNILHFYDSVNAWNVRLQRFVQNDVKMGLHPVIFVRRQAVKNSEKWIPDADKVIVETYNKSIAMAFMLPITHDHLGLKQVFKEYHCDVVHTHDLPCAYYSYKLGLPTVFNDWEYHYRHYDYETLRLLSQFSILFRMYRRRIAKNALKQLLLNVPVIVTNKAVQTAYRSFGAKKIWTIPNVPLKFEVDMAANYSNHKRNRITTCYVGNMSIDNQTRLRNTSGLQELWGQNDLGELLVLEGKNYVPHLKIFEILKSCHFNLLFWNPLEIHRFYSQNKPFLASVVGVPTIISASLTATIELLGEFAIPVNTLDEIKGIVLSDVWKHNYCHPKASHIFEYYAARVNEAYDCAFNSTR